MTAPAPRRAWWLIDGLPYWLLDKALAHAPERLPSFRKLWDEARVAPLDPLGPNCQTPPSLAALFSGRDSAGTGLCGFDQPDFAQGPLAVAKAFRKGLGGLPLIWETGARPVRLLHMPFVDLDRVADKLAYFAHGFGPAVAAPAVLTPEAAVERLGARIGRDWQRVTFRTPDGRPAVGEARRALVDGAGRVLFLGAWAVDEAGDEPGRDRDTDDQAPPFMGGGLQHPYRQGALGRTLMQGGDGAAEALFVETLRRMSVHFTAAWLRHLTAPGRPEVFAYQPALDLALHELAGFVAPDCGHASARTEAVVLPLLIDLLAEYDAALAATRAALGPGDRVLATSDHGMMPVDTLVRPNTILETLGALTRDAKGGIDAHRSLCFVHPAENGLICTNPSLGDPASALTALCAALDRATGRRAEISEHPGIERRLAPPSPLTARHFLAPGRYVQFRAGLDGPAAEPTQKTGEHLATSAEPTLCGTVLDLSPGGGFAPDTRVHPTQAAALLAGEPVSV